MSIACTIVHALPSRTRLRIPDIKSESVARSLTSFLTDQPGIRAVRMNPLCVSAVVEFDPTFWTPQSLQQSICRLTLQRIRTYRPDRPFRPITNETDEAHGSAFELIMSTASLLIGFFGNSLGAAVLPWLFAGSAVPMFVRAFDALTRQGRLTVDVLDASATAVLIVQSRLSTATFMVWLVNLADFIRNGTMGRSRRAISQMLNVGSREAWVMRGDTKVRMALDQIEPGEIVVVYAGERIPVDGRIVSGSAFVDQQTLTGESMPVPKTTGDDAYAATVLREGKLYIRAEHIGADTEAAKIVRLVEEAPLRETKIQNYAEQWANSLVPISFLSAAASAVLAYDLNRAASLLIIDYGTGIRVAAPTTVLAAMTKAASRGILFKGGRVFERLSEIDTVIFDKTGTLTTGVPDVVEIVTYRPEYQADDCLRLAASAERRLTHPLAQAILNAARRRGVRIPERTNSEYIVGQGVRALVDGRTVDVGNERFMSSRHVAIGRAGDDIRRTSGRGFTPVCLAVDGELVGILACADPLRSEAGNVVGALRRQGIKEIVMLTGDHPDVARSVAEAVGIASYEAGLFPDAKLEAVKRRQAQGRKVAVIGDGINDSPALAQADVGIAVSGGADVAQETAQIVLLRGGLWKIPLAFEIAHEAMSLIRQNWAIISVPNTVALVLALSGLLSPVGATMISNGSTILAAGNALRPLVELDGRGKPVQPTR
jgi:Cu2+-exporting ATPase